MPQSKHPQHTETPNESRKTPPVKYVMPGLCPEIEHEFRRRKNVIPSASTIAMNRKVRVSAVAPALFYILFERFSSLDERVRLAERRISDMTVRQYQDLMRSAA